MMDSKDEDKNSDSNIRINISKRNKFLKGKNIIKYVTFILIAIISGTIVGKLTVKQALSNEKIKGLISEFSNENDQFVQRGLSKAIEKAAYSLVTISDDVNKLRENSYSDENITGIIVKKDGYIITSYAKIMNYKKIFANVTTPGITPIEGRLVGYDIYSDIALIKIDLDNLIPIEIADRNSFIEGKFVVAIGNAISDDFVGVAFPGIISSTNDKITASDGEKYNIIQSNAIINKFNSGGPLCNSEGKLIAFNTENLSERYNDRRIASSLCASDVSRVVEKLLKMKCVLGVNKWSSIKDDKLGFQGVYVEDLDPDGGASKAGIRPTDIILSINGEDVKSPEDIYNAVKDNKKGDIIESNILRDGVKTKINITILY